MSSSIIKREFRETQKSLLKLNFHNVNFSKLVFINHISSLNALLSVIVREANCRIQY